MQINDICRMLRQGTLKPGDWTLHHSDYSYNGFQLSGIQKGNLLRDLIQYGFVFFTYFDIFLKVDIKGSLSLAQTVENSLY